MKLFMIILCIVIFVLLIIVTSVRPRKSGLSHFELVRRSNSGNDAVRRELVREKLLRDIVSLLRVSQAIFLTGFVLASVATFGWLDGGVLAIVSSLFYQSIAQSPFIRKFSHHFYNQYEVRLLSFITTHARILSIIRNVEPWQQRQVIIGSREELETVIINQKDFLSPDEVKLLLSSINFESRYVHEIMTPRRVIESIGKTELLGPLVLDDLHKTGHSRFPVVDGDVDTIVGVLHVQDMLTLDRKKSVTAERAMEPRVFYIHEDQTLRHALAAFLRTHHHLFVVVNEFRETVGLLSLEDVIEALLGQKIVDEFDTHEDLRTVASRASRANSGGKQRDDV